MSFSRRVSFGTRAGPRLSEGISSCLLTTPAAEKSENVYDGFLHQIVGFGEIARPRGQPACRPAPKARQQPRGDSFQSETIALARARQ